MDEAEIKNKIRVWIAAKNGSIGPEALRDDTPILEQRIISSLHVMDLMLYVERLRGRPLSVNEIRSGVFKDIHTIYTNFFVEAA
jgi:hypothetical protein